MSELQNINQCSAYCLAQRFDISALAKSLSETSLIRIIKGAILIEDDNTWSVVFAYGAVVHWNISAEQQTKLHQLLLTYADNALSVIEEDHFTFSLNCPATRIVEDHIEIESSDPILIFSLSQGMAQSIKLASFETNAITTINNTNYIPKSLAENGSIKLSRQNIAKIRGQLFLTKSDIILNYDLLDTPDFFWEYPEYENIYVVVAKYLEIAPRTEVLSKKLETIHELFEMLADEQKHRHSSILEWIIIWLIAIEIAMTLLDKIF
ncbi:MAG: RMD1 family protein [Methylococcaceae bacterium]|nr:RMD1 family protein [Methylococcaceae bacterium]MDP2392939.1 RMD1 family protein [Methylococcaceae bacterium]MDP3018273.1 RMD1 family protein [Methylococcaceae bacterium]MDP3391613.1 RMD1 family protein [Methylococcaceae bacterium]MDZ4155387.1 RMD1 family protein [Methylococcales bacterium]